MNTSNVKIGFAGFGNMAQAICDGLLFRQVVSPSDIYACARNMAKLQANCDARGINACGSVEEVARAADLVVMAVLPDQVETVVKEAACALKGKPVFSIAAGINHDDYVSYLGEGYNHISTVPNTPVAVGEGIIVAEKTHSLTPEQLALFEGIFGQIASIEYFDTELMSIGSTGAGCTPAFVDVFIEGLADGLVKHGMPRAKAYSILPQMMIGSARYFMESGKHPGELKDAVCSPGGTTICGISGLEECGFRYALIHGIDRILEKKQSSKEPEQ